MHMRMRIVVTMGAVGACVVAFSAVTACAAAPSPVPMQSAPLDMGSKTGGLGGAPAVQPAPPPKVDVRGDDVPSGSGPDTPGKTGLGNTDRGPVGGAATGPGTQPESGAPVGAGTPGSADGSR